MASTDIRLWCIIVDHGFHHVLGCRFPVDMPPEGAVADLKEKVKAKTEHQLAHIAPNELVVWKCPGLNDVEEDEVLVAHIHGLDFSKTEEVQRLRETRRVSSLNMLQGDILLVQMPSTYPHSILLYSNDLPLRTSNEHSYQLHLLNPLSSDGVWPMTPVSFG